MGRSGTHHTKNVPQCTKISFVVSEYQSRSLCIMGENLTHASFVSTVSASELEIASSL
uniref:Uncharacterized protein n=1 Tax=Arundo donax TaxID=35708 RepID=A0A0A8XWD7_ARUDO